MKWVEEFRERFIEVLYQTPSISTLSFSGGIESSAILFGMIEAENTPYECITFQVGEEESKDVFFAKKICNHYEIPLTVVKIPILSKKELRQECREIIDIIKFVRNIDIQCCHAYKYMIPQMDTMKLITGFYEDVHYEANKQLMIMFRDMRKGLIDEKYFQEYYRFGRDCIYHKMKRNGKVHNYKIIERYLTYYGIQLFCPFRDRKLFDITQKLTFQETNFYKGKFKKKWFITEVMFKDQFEFFGNKKNSNNMHTQGLKQYHQKVLLNNELHKDTIAVYNRL